MEDLKITCLGAGTGQTSLLRGLKKYPVTLRAIVSVTDNGGHSGKLRQLFNIPQVGDGRQCLVALAENQKIVEQLKVLPTGFNPANWFLAELLLDGYSLTDAFAVLGSLVDAKGEVIPACESDADICARFTNGEVVIGEWEIIETDKAKEIIELFLKSRDENKTEIEASLRTVSAIHEADWLIIGPGSLRTGVISALLPKGIKEAIQSFNGKMIYICNLMSQPGQTDDFTAFDHIKEVERYTGKQFDFAIVNNAEVYKYVVKYYRRIKSYPIEFGDLDSLKTRIIKTDLLPPEEQINPAAQERLGSFKKWTHLLTHDSEKMAKAVREIINNES